MKAHAKSHEVSLIGNIQKSRRTVTMTYILSSLKTGKTAKIPRNFLKFKKTKILVLGNVIMKAHAKFQEASSIRN